LMEQISPIHLTVAGQPLGAKEVLPPLASIVVVNRDYGEFVGAVLDSISRQDYPWFECVVVDNASSDDSRAVIERHTCDDPRFSTVYLDENLGQLGATLKVLDRLHGSFVAFVDADDVLFPNYLSVHLQVHLALPWALGFTSSDVVETDKAGRVMTSGRCFFGNGVRPEEAGLQDEACALRLSTIRDGDYRALSARVRTLPHWHTNWVWAPGTANMYRRACIDLTRPAPRKFGGHVGCDGYFIPMIHVLAGSALIFQPLSMYRFHDRNTYSAVPPMRTVSTGWSRAGVSSSFQHPAVLRALTGDAERYHPILPGTRYWETVNLLAGLEGYRLHDFFADPGVQTVFVETFAALAKVFGANLVLRELRSRMRFAAWRSFIGKLRQQGSASVTVWTLLGVEARRAFGKLRSFLNRIPAAATRT
jgi:glycosyltransferase involved in cell wall biosynthesis